MLERHVKNLRMLKKKYETKYETAETAKEKEEAIERLMELKLIKSDDPRLGRLTRFSAYRRDLRPGKMGAFLADCPYLKCEKYFNVDVQIEPHDGERSYKETVWKVKYPSSKTYIQLQELTEIGSMKELKKKIDAIISDNGNEWETYNDENFFKMLGSGYYVVYEAKFKNLTSTIMETCGYVFVEKVFDVDDIEVNVYSIMNKRLIESKFVISNIAIDNIEKKTADSVIYATKKFKREKAEAEKQKALEAQQAEEAAEKEEDTDEKPAKKRGRTKKETSEEDSYYKSANDAANLAEMLASFGISQQ